MMIELSFGFSHAWLTAEAINDHGKCTVFSLHRAEFIGAHAVNDGFVDRHHTGSRMHDTSTDTVHDIFYRSCFILDTMDIISVVCL